MGASVGVWKQIRSKFQVHKFVSFAFSEDSRCGTCMHQIGLNTRDNKHAAWKLSGFGLQLLKLWFEMQNMFQFQVLRLKFKMTYEFLHEKGRF